MQVDDLTHAAVGRYRVGGRLQLLPYATVHQALSLDQERPVLLWTFGEPYASAAGFIETLQQVAGDPRITQIPGLLSVLEIGQQDHPCPLVYAATESAPGGFLLAMLSHGRAPGVFAVTGPLASALDQLHSLGLVHGDVQPSMIAFSAENQPRLAGFAMRAVVNRLNHQAASDGRRSPFRPPGVPASEVSPAGDRYGLAAIVYYLLVGKPPALDGDVVPPSRIRPELPARVDQVVLRALSVDPTERFPLAADFFQALRGQPASRVHSASSGARAPSAPLTPSAMRDGLLPGAVEVDKAPAARPTSTQLIRVVPREVAPRRRQIGGLVTMLVLVLGALCLLVLAAVGKLTL